jgi:hypothetical protein
MRHTLGSAAGRKRTSMKSKIFVVVGLILLMLGISNISAG